MSRKVLQAERSSEGLPALSMMNETLKVVKQLVRESIGISDVGDELNVVQQLAPLCYTSAVAEHEHHDEWSSSTVDTQLGGIVLEDKTASWHYPTHFNHDMMQMKSVQKTIRDEVSEMQHTLEEIQNFSQSWCRSDILRDLQLRQQDATIVRIDDGHPPALNTAAEV